MHGHRLKKAAEFSKVFVVLRGHHYTIT